MQLLDLQYAFYFLSPTFVSSALILTHLVLFALASLLMNTISYSKIAVAHMLIFLFSTFCISTIPVSVSVDILLLAFIVITTIKTVGKFFSLLGRTEYVVNKVFGLLLTFLCLAILLDVIFADMEASGWSGMGEFSVVVGSIRKLFVEVGVDLEDAAELLFAGYFVAFCVVVVVGLWTEGWFWVPLWVALNLDLMDYRILGRAVQKLWRSVRRHCNE